ncbi:MAG: hypothetical protein ACTH8F_07555 [Microbacterium sp.]|uniref:hypothetical protein n=1 Tax=Microbacterium sp. TaxID=51671 RepID=UPI003F9A5A66
MLIYETLDDARAGEPGLSVTPQGERSADETFEADWGYRLRGAGLPGGDVGWLLTFAGIGSGFGDDHRGWLIAYEIDHDSKSGRVAVLRRDWDSATDRAEISKLRELDLWDAGQRRSQGEADIEAVDELLSGEQLR